MRYNAQSIETIAIGQKVAAKAIFTVSASSIKSARNGNVPKKADRAI